MAAPGVAAAGAPPPAPRIYTIAVAGQEPIVVPSNELPADSDELSEVLAAVAAPIGAWLDFLTEYYRQGRLGEYEKLLRKALNMRKWRGVGEGGAAALQLQRRAVRPRRQTPSSAHAPPARPRAPSNPRPPTCAASRVLSDVTQVENRVKLYVATASYELLHGSAGTRSSAASSGATAARNDAKLDAAKVQAAVRGACAAARRRPQPPARVPSLPTPTHTHPHPPTPTHRARRTRSWSPCAS